MARQSKFEFDHQFLGREFLLWLWFTADHGGRIPSLPYIIGTDSLLVMESAGLVTDSVSIKADAACATPEAGAAFRSGKKPSKVLLSVEDTDSGHTFLFQLDRSLGVTSLKLPAVLSREDMLVVSERLELVDRFECLLDELFRHFLNGRCDSVQWSEMAKSMRVWALEMA